MSDLIPVEYRTERVLTTEQLAQAYECEPKQIKQNFNNNKGRFEEGKHFFKLTGDALRDFKVSLGESKISTTLKFTSILYLWTRRGASRHSKMLGTDRAWEMFDALEETYFNVRPQPKPPIILDPLKILQGSIEQLVRMDAEQKELARRIDNIGNIITLRPENWREKVNNILNRIAGKMGDKEAYKNLRLDSYKALDERYHVATADRLTRMKKRMAEAGNSKTAIAKANVLDVIEADPKLTEGYIQIVKEYAIKYGLDLEEEAQ